MSLEKKFSRLSGIVGGAVIVLAGCSPKTGEGLKNSENMHFIPATKDTLEKLHLDDFNLLKNIQFRTDSTGWKATEIPKSDTLEVRIHDGVVQQTENQSPTDTLVLNPNLPLMVVDTIEKENGGINLVLRAEEPDGLKDSTKILIFALNQEGQYRLAYNRKNNTIDYGDKVFKVDTTLALPKLEFATRKTNNGSNNTTEAPEGTKAPKGTSPKEPIKIVRSNKQ